MSDLTAQKHYNKLIEEGKAFDFTKLTSTGISSNYEKVFDFAESYFNARKQVNEDIIKTKKALDINGVSVSVADVRQAFGDYVSTEGCSCCQDIEGHNKASNRLGELLKADKYDDDDGFDWYKYATER